MVARIGNVGVEMISDDPKYKSYAIMFADNTVLFTE